MVEQLWKLPSLTNKDKIKKLKGDEGTLLNPVQDINGDWFIGQEELASEEFKKVKDKEKKGLLKGLVLTDYIKPIDLFVDEFGNPL